MTREGKNSYDGLRNDEVSEKCMYDTKNIGLVLEKNLLWNISREIRENSEGVSKMVQKNNGRCFHDGSLSLEKL